MVGNGLEDFRFLKMCPDEITVAFTAPLVANLVFLISEADSRLPRSLSRDTILPGRISQFVWSC